MSGGSAQRCKVTGSGHFVLCRGDWTTVEAVSAGSLIVHAMFLRYVIND
ncbi:hypothetical protein [Paraburkholderia ginsengisoli]|uniref:Uncharacterized protein n=1 Tax=Paraburkholderia ginsengisoli TaxID=311231 RepID=A0A7T4N346_9BURK|nr:hypothetical protein [Paraburkholderia ginsengisoli]QQC64375.1 hypothetical protein I6I06_02460 [Paraburkholderia ginsengisoli]